VLLAAPAGAGAYSLGPTVTGLGPEETAFDYPGETSVNQINVEGQPLISAFRPTDTNRFQAATQTLSVCDGRLTVDAIGGTNTTINYVEVAPVSLNL
jgi:hypothetical protein